MKEGSSMKMTIKFILSFIAYTITALGVAMAVIAAIGISPYNSLNLSVALASGIRIGTVTIVFNSIFLLIYMILTKFKLRFKYLLQVLALLLFGTMVNLFVYGLFGQLPKLTYIQSLVFLTGGTILGASALGFNLYLNLITFPLESICVELSSLTNRDFKVFRYGLDILFLFIAITISLVKGLALPVREGTAISMLLFTYVVNISKTISAQKLKGRFNV